MLKVKNIHKSFGDKHVLRGIDLEIAPGTITCAIGPSGTGKTTLLRALGLIDFPDQGRVRIDKTAYDFPQKKADFPVPVGAEKGDKKGVSPWPLVTVVFQSLFLWPHLTLRENILLPARNHNENCEKDLEGLIDLFEMGHFIDHYPNEASVGQRQRVALARALILNPRYILLDEITSALDVEQTARILTKLGHLKERGMGVFIITHALGFARHSADQIIFMDGGKVVETGAPDILKNPQSERFQEFLHLAAQAN